MVTKCETFVQLTLCYIGTDATCWKYGPLKYTGVAVKALTVDALMSVEVLWLAMHI